MIFQKLSTLESPPEVFDPTDPLAAQALVPLFSCTADSFLDQEPGRLLFCLPLFAFTAGGLQDWHTTDGYSGWVKLTRRNDRWRLASTPTLTAFFSDEVPASTFFSQEYQRIKQAVSVALSDPALVATLSQSLTATGGTEVIFRDAAEKPLSAGNWVTHRHPGVREWYDADTNTLHFTGPQDIAGNDLIYLGSLNLLALHGKLHPGGELLYFYDRVDQTMVFTVDY